MMFSLSNNGNDPISYGSEQAANNMPFLSDIISNSKQYYVPPPLSFCHLPSPFFAYDQLELEDHPMFPQQNYDLLSAVLLQQQPQPLRDRDTTTSTDDQSTAANRLVGSNTNDVTELTEMCNKQSNSSSTHDQIPRKRSCKRDRHSKINTAQGPRDRRMRLSLKVAREFFDLQDKLQFDKASKTVEWLLTKAKNEIKKVSSSGFQLPMNYSCSTTTVETKSASSTSECEVLSEINTKGSKSNNNSVSKGGGKSSSSVCGGKKERKAATSSSRASRKTTTASSSPFGKESREKARARARERTKEILRRRRRLIDESKLCESDQETNNIVELNQFTGFEIGDQESGTHNINPSLVDVQLEEVGVPIYHEQERLCTPEGMLDQTFVSMGHDWSTPFPNHLQNNNGIHQEHQFTDFEYNNLCKTWDDQAYNNIDGMC